MNWINSNFELTNTKVTAIQFWVRLVLIGIILAIMVLTYNAAIKYHGKAYIYIIFTILLNTMLFLGFRKNRLFFDTFIGIYFWLGYWLKFSFRVAFIDGKFYEPIGKNFDYSGAAYDKALLVTSIGIAAFILVSIIRERYLSKNTDKITKNSLPGLFAIYKRYRILIWCCFIGLVLFVSITNAYFGIYQRGSAPETQLPVNLGCIYKWLLLFGTASISALIIDFEISIKNRPTSRVATLAIFESFMTNTSMMSRGMVFNIFALAVGTGRSLKARSIKLGKRFLMIVSMIFVLLFLFSVVFVKQWRVQKFCGNLENLKTYEFSAAAKFVSKGVKLRNSIKNLKILIIDRWVGIEGVMAVSSYHDLGWNLWRKAWHEKYSNYGTSFYDNEIVSSGYNQNTETKYHFISLPGILAFCYYPGSYFFLFISLCLAALFAALMELWIYKISDGNMILTSLLAQVIAWRYVHFGYAPGQSYLLFGSIILNVLIVYFFNKILMKQLRVVPSDESANC